MDVATEYMITFPGPGFCIAIQKPGREGAAGAKTSGLLLPKVEGLAKYCSFALGCRGIKAVLKIRLLRQHIASHC